LTNGIAAGRFARATVGLTEAAALGLGANTVTAGALRGLDLNSFGVAFTGIGATEAVCLVAVGRSSGLGSSASGLRLGFVSGGHAVDNLPRILRLNTPAESHGPRVGKESGSIAVALVQAYPHDEPRFGRTDLGVFEDFRGRGGVRFAVEAGPLKTGKKRQRRKCRCNGKESVKTAPTIVEHPKVLLRFDEG
jgi:hypothetical protein